MPDVNGSSFHLLLSEADWFRRPGPTGNLPVLSGAPETDLEWTASCGLRLRRTVPFDRTASPARLGPTDRRGSDRDPDGVFWHVGNDPSTLWRTRDGDAAQFWPVGAYDERGKEGSEDFTVCTPSVVVAATLGAVAVTRDRWLVVGVLDPGDGPNAGPGLLLFDLLAGGEPVWRDWSRDVPDFHPVDACQLPGGGLLVLDAERDRSDATRVWHLDGHANPSVLAERPVPAVLFEACDRDPAAPPTGAHTVGVPVPWVLPVALAVSVAAVDETSYLVLDAGTRRVLRFESDNLTGTLDLDEALEGRLSDPSNDPAVRGHDIAVVRDATGRAVLFVSDAGGDEVFTFDIDNGFAALAENYPMRRHQGRGLVTDATTVWFDTRRRWHPLLARGRSQYRSWGTVVTSAFDGHQRGCRWHRLAMDGRLPAGTSVRVESRAAEDVATLASMPWRVEPTPYLRRGGTELSLDTAVGPVDARGLGTWETLLQRADGRYCQLRLTLGSPGGSTPEIRALRLIYPRFSYLHRYLPQVYADEDAPGRFLERYLANTEGLLTDLEGRIADADLLFDGRSVPSQYLGWLASWLGTVFDADLDVRRRRLFLQHASKLFATRGTSAGLVLALRLVLDECPEAAFEEGTADSAFTVRIAERYLSRSASFPLPGGPMVLADDLATGAPGGDTAPASRWSARLGANELHQRFQDDLIARYGADWSTAAGPASVPSWLRNRVPSTVRVSPTAPADASARGDWTRFLGVQLGLRSPAFGDQHLPLYRRFLLQRYERPARYAAAYQIQGGAFGFEQIRAPERLPSFGPALQDWETFVAVVVPIAESAHRFSVLLPVDLDAPEREQLRALDRARRVVEIEKPAHTAFDVRPYWAAFQLGDARLGIDTRLGAGARRGALVLDRSRLAQAGLAPTPGHTGECGC